MTGAPTPAPDTPQGEMTPAQQTAAAIAAQAQQRQQISSLAEALIPQTQPGAIVSKAKIMGVQWGFPPTVTIQLGGDTSTNISAVRFLDSYVPTIGDTVVVVKQGSELFVLGQMMDNLSAAANGWQVPVLTSTWNANLTPNELTPVRYRMVYDHGMRKIQLMGRVWRNGSNIGTTLFTLPAGYTPGVVRTMVAARENLPNGSNVIQVQALVNGNVEITGQNLGAVGGNYGNSDTVTVAKPPSGHPRPNEASTGGPFLGDTGTAHQHGMEHSHTITINSAVFPGWVSLDGLEFFL